MIPPGSPSPTDSEGERQLYRLLRDGLSDEFTVIHSLEWLSQAARELAGVKAVTGEIDFLVLHAQLGVLAVEVKGGVHKVASHRFVHVKTGNTTSPVRQVRTGSHGLARWLGEATPSLMMRIGYAVVFPHSDFNGQDISCALVDHTVSPPAAMLVDKPDIPRLGERIVNIMRYWKQALGNPALGTSRMSTLVSILCPEVDGTPSWACRMQWDNRLWLLLTSEQQEAMELATAKPRSLVTGWPGTGKTLILAEVARRMLAAGKHVLVLTFNALLTDHLRHQIGDHASLRTSTWHSFCATFRSKSADLQQTGDKWLNEDCLQDVIRAAEVGELSPFDAVLVDEGQAFRREWMTWLVQWQAHRPLLVFGDETQVFEFEKSRMSLAELSAMLGVPAFTLTIPIRSPKAVLQRLVAVHPPNMQLHSPREFEPDTLQELLKSSRDHLSSLIAELKQDGFHGSDIVLLSKMGWTSGSMHDGVRLETLSRFRGLESPVVVIVGAEQMTETELFCAYSRATTRCIALYDAEQLGVRGPKGRFGTTLLAEPTNAAMADAARRAAQTGEIIRAHLDASWFETKTVKLGWAKAWGGWLLEHRDDLSSFWIDCLATETRWPVYVWDERSIRTLSIAVPPKKLDDARWAGSFEVSTCASCRGLTPHRVLPPQIKQCMFSHRHDSDDDEREIPPDGEHMALIGELDALVSTDPKQLTPEKRRRLPISLAAGAALAYAQQHAQRQPREPAKAPLGRPLYRAAWALVYAMAYWARDGKRLSVKDLSQLWYVRYRMPPGLTAHQWHTEVASAFNVACQKGHLRRLEQGLYTPDGAGIS